MTLRELLPESVGERAQALLEKSGESTPWFVKLSVGAGTWVGALFVALAFTMTGLYEEAPVAVPLGLLLLVAAAFVSRKTEWLGTPQLVLVLSFGGQILLYPHLFEDLERTPLLLSLAALQALLFWAVKDLTHRFLAAAAGLVCLYLAWESSWALLVPMLALALLTELLLREGAVSVKGLSALSRPFVFAAGLVVLGVFIWVELANVVVFTQSGLSQPLFTWRSTLLSLGTAAVGARVGLAAFRESGPVEGRLRYVILGAALVTALMSLKVPGLALAFVLLLLSQARREPVLAGLSLLSLFLFYWAFYYSLEMSLLEKSAWVGGTGLLFLALYALGFRREESGSGSRGLRPKSREGWALVLTALTVLLFVSGLAYSRESIRRSGTRVLLKLAPVDPRSLIQGDYMVLDYALNAEVAEKLERPRQADVKALLRLDDEGVGSLVALDPGRGPEGGEALVQVRIRGHQPRIGAESFFFEEGQAELYEKARYGELRVSDSGVVLLVGLLDEQHQRLGDARR